MKSASPIVEEMNILSALLQDENFAAEMLAASEPFENPGLPLANLDHESLIRSFKDEKIAISLAPFYALQCGIQALIPTHPHYNFLEWLEQFLNNNLSADQLLMLNRFANATWKAGQPFRDLARIKRHNFISAALLPPDEVAKDYHQLYAAAEKIHPILLPLKDSGNLLQLQKLQELTRNPHFAAEMAMHVDAAYYIAQQQNPPAFLMPGEAEKQIRKTVHAEKTATALAAFYALESGLSYFASQKQVTASAMLVSVIDGSLSTEDKRIFDCFAHATFMAGTVFKGLDGMVQPGFGLFCFLEEDRIEYYHTLIKAAAFQVQKYL